MPEKMGKKEWPKGHGANDFQCFGPPALKDGQFSGTKICDMGCFNQGEVDSNKYYHGAVVKSKISGNWFAYFEWGRVGNTAPDFQFIDCGSDEPLACKEYEKQLLSKNLKRGVWKKHPTLGDILEPKPGETSLYIVRPQATRATGLPDAKTIKTNDSAKPVAVTTTASKGSAKLSKPKADPQTLSLMRDLNVATVDFTRGSMADASLPTQGAIDEARTILTEAQRRLVVVGDDVDTQSNDKEMLELTRLIYGRIPKKKKVGAPASEWVLSSNNIFGWQNDINAFEQALYTVDHSVAQESDPFDGMAIDMSWIDPKSSIGAWLNRWAPKATRNKHHNIGDMKIHNAWRVARHGDEAKLHAVQDKIAADRNSSWSKETPLHQDEGGYPELPDARKSVYKKSHTALLLHGSRSVNVSSILRKSLMLPQQLVGVVLTGALLGTGCYFADDIKKSAGYTSLSGSIWSGGAGAVKGRHAFMFVAEVVCGNPHTASGCHGYTSAPKGCHSVFGKGDHTKLNSYRTLQNNEWVVYKTDQFMLRYLLEFSA